MRLLLDECVPKRLKRELPDHEVHTVVEMGWSSKRNVSDLNGVIKGVVGLGGAVQAFLVGLLES